MFPPRKRYNPAFNQGFKSTRTILSHELVYFDEIIILLLIFKKNKKINYFININRYQIISLMIG